MITSCSVTSIMTNVSDKSCKQNQNTHFYWPTNAFNCIKLKGLNLRSINFKRQLKNI